MNDTLRIMLVTALLVIELTTLVSAQQATTTDDEIANAPIDPGLAAMNQAILKIGEARARVTQLSLMVNKDYPPGQPTLYVAAHTLRLPTQFVANDPRRRPDVGLEWTFDTRRSEALTLVNGISQILTSAEAVQQTRLAVTSWATLPCYSANFGEVPYPVAPGYENIEWVDDFYLGREPQPFIPVAEITVGGFLPASFFRLRFGTNGDNVLGVAYQFAFYDRATGQPTDIDHNGKLDGFWTEIYFNDLYYWGDATAPGVEPFSMIDLQTVALHEAGHAFGLGHFGQLFGNHGGFKIAGYNIMSQYYPGPFHQLGGTPTGTFCGLYADWH